MTAGFDIANPTEEHRMLRDMVRNFVLEEVEPQALEHDRLERFNSDLFRKLGPWVFTGSPLTRRTEGLEWTPPRSLS